MTEGRNVEQRVDSLETKFELFMKSQDERFNTFMHELQQQREDIRRLQDRQDADRKALESKIDSKFDKLSEQLHTMTIAAVVGFGAIVVAIAGVVVSILK